MQGLAKRQILERLLNERKISREQGQLVLEYAAANGSRVEDALIETGALDESSLLTFLAALYQTRFVPTEKLAKAEIDRPVLALIPRDVSERLCVFPVKYDGQSKTLAFVTPDPDNAEILRDVRAAARVQHAYPYLARPAAVRAAISKYLNGDIHAFSKLEQRNVQKKGQLFETFGHTLFDEETIASRSATGLRTSLAPGEGPPTLTRNLVLDPPAMERSLDAPRNDRSFDSPRNSLTPLGFGAVPSTRADLKSSLLPVAFGSSPNTAQRELPPSRELGGLTSRTTPAGMAGDKAVSFSASAELTNVLVSLLENKRELRGHSAQVSRFMQKVGDHMQLSRAEVYALRLCGLLHDVGKTASYHLTALNVSEYEGHRVEALKCFMSPVRLFDGANLPRACIEGITSVYERFDGQGFPDRRVGKDIPLAARLLAIAESYADLTANPRNAFRRMLTAKAAIEVLGRYKEKIFDGDLVDLFRVAALGDDMQSQLLNDRARVLLVDSDADETTVLELRLVEQGYEVLLCRTAEQAYKTFQHGGVDVIIAEVDLKPHDGFTLIEHVRRARGGAEVPVLFLTRRTERAAVDRGFSLGAVDYMSKPAAPDVVLAKLRSVLGRIARAKTARGVSGSLSEMPLPDVIQVLARTRKSGLLRVTSGDYAGEIQIGSGSIYNASFLNLRGEEALFALLMLQEGEFALDPTFVPNTRAIHETTEQLLLEGMRRSDESVGEKAPVDFSQTRADEP